MKKFLAGLFILALCSFAPRSSYAIIDILELRLGYGITDVSPADFNRSYTAIDSGLKLEELTAFHAEALVNLPVLPIGFGLRYEQGGADESATPGSGPIDYDLSYNRISAVGNFRFIDTIVFLGPIVTIGYQDGEIEQNSSGVNTKESLDGDGLSYTIGAEGGVTLRKIILGAEIGYQVLKFEKSSSFRFDTDLSGVYGRALIGYKF